MDSTHQGRRLVNQRRLHLVVGFLHVAVELSQARVLGDALAGSRRQLVAQQLFSGKQSPLEGGSSSSFMGASAEGRKSVSATWCLSVARLFVCIGDWGMTPFAGGIPMSPQSKV